MSKKAFRCKNIYTALTPQLIDGFVICDDNKILFVGREEDAKDFIDDTTEIYRFDDNFLMPGFNDFHVHLITGALMEHDGVLRYANTEEEAAQMLWEKNKDREGSGWILGGAWDNFKWPDAANPTRKSLDKYFPDTPVFLLNKECHGAWANGEALRRFNITKDTPDPEHGSFFRFEDGEPTGYVHEAAVIPLLKGILEEMTVEDMASYAKSFAETANSYGITSVGDLPLYGIRADSSYKVLEERGELSVRIFFALAFMEEMKDIFKARDEYASDRLSFIGVKDFLDGTPMGHTGFMLEPYTDMADFKSESMIEPEFLKKRVAEMTEQNVKVRLHACGDGAVRLALDAFEYANEKFGGKDLRHCVEHIEATTPEDMARFGKLGVIPSVQPDHLPKYDFANHPFHTMISDDRMQYSWPFKSIADDEGILAFGTDYPVTELNPMRGIYRAVTRLTDEGEPEGGFNPKERVSVHDALRAYTYGSAYAAGKDEMLGTLESGKFADMAIFEKNVFECVLNREEMFGNKVLMTVVDGKIVYKS